MPSNESIGLDAPQRRSRDHVGDRKPERYVGPGEQFGANDGMAVECQIVLGCLGEFGSCRLAHSLLPLGFGIAAISARAAFVARQIAFVNLDLPGVADFDEGGAAVFHRRFDM